MRVCLFSDDNIYDIELYLKSDPTVSISQKLVDLGVVRTVAKPITEEEEDEGLIMRVCLFSDDNIYDIELYLKSDPTVSISQKLVDLGVVRTVAKPITEEEEDDMPDLVWPDGSQWDVYITYVTSTNSVMLRLVGEEYSVSTIVEYL